MARPWRLVISFCPKCHQTFSDQEQSGFMSKMDNNAKKETSEASMILDREDMQDILQIEKGGMEL